MPIERLKVLSIGEMPADARNATIDESFVPEAEAPAIPKSPAAWATLRDRWLEQLRSKVFGGWPSAEEAGPLGVAIEPARAVGGGTLLSIDFNSQAGVRLRAYLYVPAESDRQGPPVAVVLDEQAWAKVSTWIDHLRGASDADRSVTPSRIPSLRALDAIDRGDLTGRPVAMIVPRGVGPTAWAEGSLDTHVRRRFPLIGQTLDGMRAWDVRRALAALREIKSWPGDGAAGLELAGAGDAATLALWAGVFEPGVRRVSLVDPPGTFNEGPAFLNIDRVLDVPQAIALLEPKPVVLVTQGDRFDWTRRFAEAIAGDGWLSRP